MAPVSCPCLLPGAPPAPAPSSVFALHSTLSSFILTCSHCVKARNIVLCHAGWLAVYVHLEGWLTLEENQANPMY